MLIYSIFYVCAIITNFTFGLKSRKVCNQIQSPQTHSINSAAALWTEVKRNSDISISSEEYINPVTKFLGLFLPDNVASTTKLIKTSKRKKSNLQTLAKDLENSLKTREWFVNGNVDTSFFDNDFTFQDPDVKIKGIEEYAKGVRKIFSQNECRAEIISVKLNTTSALQLDKVLTVTWRLSGTVNIGPGFKLKPFIVYTDFTVDPVSGLIKYQLDRFSIPGYDIVLSAIFPFLLNIPGLLTPPCPPAVELRRK